MPNKETCTQCKGTGTFEALVSQHGNEKETVTCTKCSGKKVVYRMTDQEEQDYHDDYW